MVLYAKDWPIFFGSSGVVQGLTVGKQQNVS